MSEEYKDSTPYNKQWDEEDENEVAEQAGDEETDAGSDEEPAQLIQEIAFHPAIQRQNEQMLEHARKTFERLQEDLRQQVSCCSAELETPISDAGYGALMSSWCFLLCRLLFSAG